MTSRLNGRIQSFRYAIRGIGTMVQAEMNAKIHSVATIAAIGLGIFLELDRIEWIAVGLAITTVWSAEGFNTAIEAICDAVSSDYHPKIERAKDVAAGAVLIASIGALLVGVLVFGRRLLALAVA